MMLHVNYREVEAQAVEMEGAAGVTVRWVLGPNSQAPNFHLRVFEVDPGGCTPRHSHAWEHEVFVLSGGGEVTSGGVTEPLTAGDVILVPGDEEHQFRAAADSPLQFICLIPVSGSCASADPNCCGGKPCAG